MEMTGLANWSCPVCGASLEAEAHTFRCQNGHSYDRAKKGYVNLLQSNQSHNKRHGDDRAMVAARTAFLDAGYYAPLCKSISEASVACCGDQPTVLDVGCGEGYYTAAVYDALIAAGKTPDVRGVDISREALIAAHRRLGALSLAVASLAHLPMAELSCDLLLNVFAPLDAAEFRRVLRPGGKLLRAVPLERLLTERRDIVSRITLPTQEDIQALFMMTPYYYKTSRADQEKLNRLESLETETAFGLLVYERI